MKKKRVMRFTWSKPPRSVDVFRYDVWKPVPGEHGLQSVRVHHLSNGANLNQLIVWSASGRWRLRIGLHAKGSTGPSRPVFLGWFNSERDAKRLARTFVATYTP